MKQLLLTFTFGLLIGFPTVFAGVPAEVNNSFVSPDDQFTLEVKRVTGEIKLHLNIKDMSQFDYVVIERSAETADEFGRCKYISGGKAQSGDFNEVDRFPYEADVYYRIKVVTKDGNEQLYPAVMLTAVKE
ncbi:MAG: hypothetical protein RLZZ367_18 [Bacteroidota bacterium]|jgi:hypothetical protein